jgi:phage shock protein C
MFCTKCGTKLEDSARFCTSCGRPATVEPVVSHAAPKKLRRILAGKKMAGVCNGFADYFDMDVTLMRLIWVGVTIVPPHIGLFAYIVSWFVLPKDRVGYTRL